MSAVQVKKIQVNVLDICEKIRSKTFKKKKNIEFPKAW